MKILNNKGYTIVELLAVIIIMMTTGTIILSILIVSLRGGNKGNTINEIRQNGNYIISQLSKSISYAKSFDGVANDPIVTGTDGNITVSNQCTSLPPNNVYKYLKITSFDGGQTIYRCDDAASTISSNSASMTTGQSLIDVSRMRIVSCNFYCTRSNAAVSPIINIKFTIETINGDLPENNTSIPFETSITPRN